MSKCKNPNCDSKRMLTVSGKVSDTCFLKFNHGPEKGVGEVGYVPCGLGFDDGSGDFIDMKVCLDCGRIQSEFPISDKKVLASMKDM